jgi:gas vesicle protein
MKNTAQNPRGGPAQPARKPRGRPYRNIPDTRSVSLLGIGMVVGAVLGAGVTLLVAPRTGRETRELLGRRARGMRTGSGVWMKLGKELRRAATAKRKQLEREEARDRVRDHRSPTGAEAV